MKSKPTKTNSMALHIWIAENGDQEARKFILSQAKFCNATLSRILGGHMPRFEIRYRIFKATGVKLNEEDQFPDLAKCNAS
jgi:hypothetical protein